MQFLPGSEANHESAEAFIGGGMRQPSQCGPSSGNHPNIRTSRATNDQPSSDRRPLEHIRCIARDLGRQPLSLRVSSNEDEKAAAAMPTHFSSTYRRKRPQHTFPARMLAPRNGPSADLRVSRQAKTWARRPFREVLGFAITPPTGRSLFCLGGRQI
jgi:hypothetical protein